MVTGLDSKSREPNQPCAFDSRLLRCVGRVAERRGGSNPPSSATEGCANGKQHRWKRCAGNTVGGSSPPPSARMV